MRVAGGSVRQVIGWTGDQDESSRGLVGTDTVEHQAFLLEDLVQVLVVHLEIRVKGRLGKGILGLG